MTGEVESLSSPIRRQAVDVKYPEKVERRPDRIPNVRYPEKVEWRWDRIPDVRHPEEMRTLAGQNFGYEIFGEG